VVETVTANPRLGLTGADRGGEGARVVRRHERRLDPQPAQRDVEQGVGPAVQRRARDHVVARLGERGEQQRLRRLAAAGRDRADPALEAGDALLERRDGRVGQPAVDVAVLLQGEEIGGVLRVLEDERGGLVDRDGSRASGRIGAGAGVDGPGPQAPAAVLGRGAHDA
jgi:hypothetical protein